MTLLITGLVLWTLAHLLKSIAPGLRTSMTAKLGENPARGIMGLLLLLSVYLMVKGFTAAPVDLVYLPPDWGIRVNNTLMLFAVALLGLGNFKGRARTKIRHPMLTGAVVWSIAHLLANGDIGSVVLFGWIGVWAIVEMFAINARDGAWERPAPGPVSGDVIWLVASVAIFAAIAGIHYWIGPSPFGG